MTEITPAADRGGAVSKPAAPHRLTALEAVSAIQDRRLSSADLVQDCLDRIAECEPGIKAWAFLDPERALAQARAADDAMVAGKASGPLHGIPVGVKDIFDTADMPTESGSVVHRGRAPRADSAVVERLRAAGAVIMGKTVTTEFALFTPGKTGNPHDPARTPGGSSSGSAAAVAASMVPLAVGSQTAGSVIRPASFCGVVGFKPSHGAISRYGVLPLSRVLDHVGGFARTLDDIALLTSVLAGPDARDPDTADAPPGGAYLLPDPVLDRPRFAYVRLPFFSAHAEPDTLRLFENLAARLDNCKTEVDPRPVFDDMLETHRIVMERDVARHRAAEYRDGRDELSPRLLEIIERGQQVSDVEYARALEKRAACRDALDDLFRDVDAILTLAAAGPAPLGLHATGDPAFAIPWTLCGVPTISLPLLHGEGNLPVGVQLVGAAGRDGHLMEVAKALTDAVHVTQ